MQIGFLINKISYGGGERIQQTLISEFAKRGHIITIFSWNKDLTNNHILHKTVILDNPPKKIIGRIKAFKKFSMALKKEKPDCLILFGVVEVCAFSALIQNIPIIFSERVDPRFRPESKMFRLIKKIIYSYSNGIIFQTEEVRAYFSKSIQKKSIVIPNPILDDNLPDPILIGNRKEIVAVGRLSVEKNYEMLIRAFSNINNNTYTLHIYGNGVMFTKLNQLIISLGKEDVIKLEGEVNLVVEKIVNAEIFVLCSNNEGMPNALIEAMAVGLACISTDFPSRAANQLITNYKSGILIPVRNQTALENAMKLLISDDELRLSLKKEAVKVRTVLQKEPIIDKWIDYIEKIINNTKIAILYSILF